MAIAALVNRPLTSLIWLQSSGIKGVADLKGKTVATAGIPYQEAFLKTILERAKVDPSTVKPVNVGFGLLPALVGGQAQAMLGGYSNVEGVDLQQRGKAPVITPVDQLGVPTYDELVVIANRERAGIRTGALSASSSPRSNAAPTPPSPTRRQRPRRSPPPTATSNRN